MNDLEEKIVSAAKELFIAKGYERTSMSDIASRVGINRPSLHYYFRTKERMFQAVAGTIADEFIPKMSGVIGSDIPFICKIEKILDCYMAIYKKNPDLLVFLMNESRRDIGMLRRFADSRQVSSYIMDFLQAVNDEMEAGRLKKVPLQYFAFQLLSQMIFPFIAKPVIMSALEQQDDDFEKMIDTWKSYVLDEFKTLIVG